MGRVTKAGWPAHEGGTWQPRHIGTTGHTTRAWHAPYSRCQANGSHFMLIARGGGQQDIANATEGEGSRQKSWGGPWRAPDLTRSLVSTSTPCRPSQAAANLRACASMRSKSSPEHTRVTCRQAPRQGDDGAQQATSRRVWAAARTASPSCSGNTQPPLPQPPPQQRRRQLPPLWQRLPPAKGVQRSNLHPASANFSCTEEKISRQQESRQQACHPGPPTVARAAARSSVPAAWASPCPPLIPRLLCCPPPGLPCRRLQTSPSAASPGRSACPQAA